MISFFDDEFCHNCENDDLGEKNNEYLLLREINEIGHQIPDEPNELNELIPEERPIFNNNIGYFTFLENPSSLNYISNAVQGIQNQIQRINKLIFLIKKEKGKKSKIKIKMKYFLLKKTKRKKIWKKILEKIKLD